ncbi:MAG TPA: toll/interleukin-1 receptor domain-containing protein [Chthoniobacterales bacterium]|nr:toll/interleukin-1 receptor domain-containing protein [Chthoniobacterales bacterium]
MIVIHHNHLDARDAAKDLIAAIRQRLDDLGAKAARHEIEAAGFADSETNDVNALHVLVCDGVHGASLDRAIYRSVEARDRAWILPVMKHDQSHRVTELLDKELQKRNIAFWEDKVEELALVVLARAGVTCLDRRVFVSYRRSETSALADQLFDQLSRRNFQVFLDRVSVEPGVDFQAVLFEHLADKSMVVLLNSKEFPESRWTMAELEFARQRRLNVLILQLPDADKNLGGSASEVIHVRSAQTESVSIPGVTKPQVQLKQDALEAIADRIVGEHDLMLVGRIRNIRECVIAAARRRSEVTYTASKYDSSITLTVSPDRRTSRQYVIYPTGYPPWVAELFDASIRTHSSDTSRIIIGHTASLLPLRTKQLEWLVDGRNVGYHDICSVDALFDKLVAG